MDSFRRAAALLLPLLVALVLGASSCGVPTQRGCPGQHCGCNGPTDCYCNDGTTRCEWTCESEGCKGRCNRDSECIFEAGAGSDLICDRASCSFTVGAGSTVSCINGGTCRIQCEAECDIDCSEAGPCYFACAGETVARQLRGSDRCP